MALLIGFSSLVRSVWLARTRSDFPLFALLRDWLGSQPQVGSLAVGALAGIASVLIVPLAGQAAGVVRIDLVVPVSLAWVGLAVASVGMKAAFVCFEETIFRGSLCSEIGRVLPPALTVVATALIFSAAHASRSPMGLAILFVDGIGFAGAFLSLRSLWLPLSWHLSKNVSVWLVYGAGTVELVPGLFRVAPHELHWLVGSPSAPGFGDLIVSCLVVGVVFSYLKIFRTARTSTS